MKNKKKRQEVINFHLLREDMKKRIPLVGGRFRGIDKSALELKVSNTSLSSFMIGRQRGMQIERLSKIAKWLGFPVERYTSESSKIRIETENPLAEIRKLVNNDSSLNREGRRAVLSIFETAYFHMKGS